MENLNFIFEFLKTYLMETLLFLFGSIGAALRVIRPKLFFKSAIWIMNAIFKVNLNEAFSVTEHALLMRIKEMTFANRVAFIEFRRNGETEITVLSEVSEKGKPLATINNTQAHEYRDFIDDLNAVGGSICFDEKTPRHADFFKLINKGFGCKSFSLVPIYQNDAQHHVVVVFVGYENFKIFDKNDEQIVRNQGTKIAKIAYLSN
jgi:hypothetical protein